MRLAQGYMGAEEFVAFLRNDDGPKSVWLTSELGGWMLVLVILAIVMGGMAMNLTPCVLPMIPINLMIIGRSAAKGAWYGLGITIAYGLMGVLASVGGMAFGTIQSNPWFNLAVAVVFVLLALSLMGVFFIDMSKSRSKFRGGAFLMGMLAAVLAGACVAPILIAVLLLTAKQFAAGNVLALGLPFLLGLGMGLPWPFIGAGMKVLPKPGGWMKWVNRGFAVLVLGFAVWYGKLSYDGFRLASSGGAGDDGQASLTLANFEAALASAKRPVLVDCWATWCKNCTAMERTTLRDPKVRAELERFTVLRLQAEDINALKRVPGYGDIIGLPCFAIYE